jgi:hypothetical protein
MRWSVQYSLSTDMTGLMIFSAQGIDEAEQYVREMCTKYGHTNVFDLILLPPAVTLADLYRLYPRNMLSLVDVDCNG